MHAERLHGPVRALFAAVDTGSDSSLAFVLPPNIAKNVSCMTGPSGFASPDMSLAGGTLAGTTALVSDAVLPDQVVLVDAAQVFGDAEAVVLDSSRHASIVLDDAPTPGAGTITSLWMSTNVGVVILC